MHKSSSSVSSGLLAKTGSLFTSRPSTSAGNASSSSISSSFAPKATTSTGSDTSPVLNLSGTQQDAFQPPPVPPVTRSQQQGGGAAGASSGAGSGNKIRKSATSAGSKASVGSLPSISPQKISRPILNGPAPGTLNRAATSSQNLKSQRSYDSFATLMRTTSTSAIPPPPSDFHTISLASAPPPPPPPAIMSNTAADTVVRPSTSANPSAAPPSLQAQGPEVIFQHIHEVSSKRITTLDYLRNVYNGQRYWFNTYLATRAEPTKLSQLEARKQARRATNYLLLGLSIPAVLETSTSSAIDYLKTMNSLLSEFESFQAIHPADGTTSSLSRARLPSMFKRSGTTKARRTSGAADIGPPMHSSSDPSELKSMISNSSVSNSTTATSSLQGAEQELLKGEEYAYLLTPSLPFDPDLNETFATLCDTLIDCYTKVMTLIATPQQAAANGVGEMFAKADQRLRKVIITGVVKEFEDTTRQGLKTEMSSVGKVVIGGFM